MFLEVKVSWPNGRQENVVRRVPWSLYSVQIQTESFPNCVLLSKSLGFCNLSFLIYKMEVKINTAPSIIGSQEDEKIRQSASRYWLLKMAPGISYAVVKRKPPLLLPYRRVTKMINCCWYTWLLLLGTRTWSLSKSMEVFLYRSIFNVDSKPDWIIFTKSTNKKLPSCQVPRGGSQGWEED